MGPLRQAENLWVEIVDEDLKIEVVGRDDGLGAAPIEPGQGLIGMRERLMSLGGTVEIDSPAACGFRVRAMLPLAGASA